jgi:hypothetical protein
VFGKNLFRCVVEDNKDPKFLGRVRLRVVGVHSAKIEDINPDYLPWSDVLQSPTMANTIGGNVNVPIGTWGYCIPLDESFTNFLMVGSIKGVYPEEPTKTEPLQGKEIGFKGKDEDLSVYPMPLIPNEPSNPMERPNGDHTKTEYIPITVDTFTEPENTAKDVEYPHNKVYEDHNGNIIEIDGTKNNPRIRVQHHTGTRVDINTKGDISIQASSTGNIWFETPGLYAIDADGNMIIEGDLKITGNLEVGVDITAGQNVTAKSHIDDSKGTLDSLRLQHDANVTTFNGHIHTGDSGGNTSAPHTPESPDPTTPVPDFKWVGTPV